MMELRVLLLDPWEKKCSFCPFNKWTRADTNTSMLVFGSMLMNNFGRRNIYIFTRIVWATRRSERIQSLLLFSDVKLQVGECAGVPRNVQYLCLSVVSMLPRLLLEDLLRARGRDVQEPPGCAGVQLLLVPTQRPHVHHSHHLPLDDVEKRCQFQRDGQIYRPDSLYYILLPSDSALMHEKTYRWCLIHEN